MSNKLFKKKYLIDAEMFGKASFFTAANEWRDYLRGICIAPTSALNDGINIIASTGFYLVIFNDSACDNINFPSHSIWIDCVRKGGKLTNFIKDCRDKTILKKYQNFELTFLDKAPLKKCRIRFNDRQYTFDYGIDFPKIDHIISKIKIPLKNEAMGYNPQFIQKVKHINLSWHPKGAKDLLLLSRCDSGQLLAIKPGVIYIAMPLCVGKKKSALQRFVTGISYDQDSKDLFSVAFKKRAYKKEFGSLLANELFTKKANFYKEVP